jgi:hypothetical protein
VRSGREQIHRSNTETPCRKLALARRIALIVSWAIGSEGPPQDENMSQHPLDERPQIKPLIRRKSVILRSNRNSMTCGHTTPLVASFPGRAFLPGSLDEITFFTLTKPKLNNALATKISRHNHSVSWAL